MRSCMPATYIIIFPVDEQFANSLYLALDPRKGP